MEQIRNELGLWLKVAWSNQDIMEALGVGKTKASAIHQQAKRHNGLFKGNTLKTKVKSDAVCNMLGIDKSSKIKELKALMEE